MSSAALALALLLASPAASEPPAAAPRPAEPRTAAPARLADLSFLSGRWVGVEPEPFSEESWGTASGDSMVGTWRLVAKGRTKLFELLTLLEEEGRVALRLRHFDRHGVAWEEKDAPLVLPLVAKGRDLAVFEGTERGSLLRLTYRREGTSLTVVLEKGAEPPETYRFRRAR